MVLQLNFLTASDLPSVEAIDVYVNEKKADSCFDEMEEIKN